MKEIVITNPNGITLHTKKSLVDDDIKIKVDDSIKAVEGVIQGESGQIMVATSPEKAITISGDHDEINITNGTVKLNLNAYTEITLSDNSEINLITADNLTPENIKKDVNILGVTGTFEGGSSGNTLKNLLDNTKSCYYLFNNYRGDNLSDLIQYNDTENVTNFSYMHQNCIATSFPQLNTSLGTDFSRMYYNDYNGTSFPILETKNGTKFDYMYYCCTKASYLKLDTIKASSLSAVFYECTKATKLEITHYNITSTSQSGSMFKNCYILKALIIRSFGASYVLNSNAFTSCFWLLGETHATYNPNGEQGYVYVPRDMIATLQSATNWSTLQFRALEDYTKDGTTTGEFDDTKAGL